MKTYEQAYAAYRGYLAKFNADHPNNEQYRPITVSEWELPSTDGAENLGSAWQLNDGRVIKKVFNGNHCYGVIYPSREAFRNFREPLSKNQFYHG